MVIFTKITPSDIPELCAMAEEIWKEHYYTCVDRALTDYVFELFQSEESVKRQLDMMKKLSGPASGKDQRRRLQELLLLGTYVKRRCNLSLIQKEYGSVPEEDFRLSFQDMLSALSLIGVPTEFDWQTGLQLDCEEAIDAFEWFEEILEMEQYAFTKVSILAREGALILRLIGTDVDERILEGTAAAGPRLEGR